MEQNVKAFGDTKRRGLVARRMIPNFNFNAKLLWAKIDVAFNAIIKFCAQLLKGCLIWGVIILVAFAIRENNPELAETLPWMYKLLEVMSDIVEVVFMVFYKLFNSLVEYIKGLL